MRGKDSNPHRDVKLDKMSLKDPEGGDDDLRERVQRVIEEDRELFDALDN